MDVRFLTPLGAVLALTLVVPLAVLVLRERRARSVRASLGLAQTPLRGRAQLEVTLQARVARDPHLQSQQLNNLGVLTMGRYSTDSQEATQILARGVGAFQNAIEVDPNNLDALRNLEILLRRPEAATLPPNNPSQGGAQGRVSGQGRVGSGY